MAAHKALVVAIADYGPGHEKKDLPGAAHDLQKWQCLLANPETYGCTVTTLADSEATLGAVKDALEATFANAEPGDRRVFVFSGHGTITSDGKTQQQALELYPHSGGHHLRNRLLTAAIKKAKVPKGVLLTFIIDACFAGAIEVTAALLRSGGSDVEEAGQPRFWPPERPPDDSLRLKIFGKIGPVPGLARPLLIAAAGKYKKAYERVMPDGKLQGVFSYYANECLGVEPKTKHEDVIGYARKQMQNDKYDQEPTGRGNTSRLGEPFLD